MSYEAWRVSFQSSEQAARSAYELLAKERELRVKAEARWLSERKLNDALQRQVTAAEQRIREAMERGPVA